MRVRGSGFFCPSGGDRSSGMFPYANHELSGVDLFLYQQLTANAALLALLAVQPMLPDGVVPLAVYSELATESAVPPYVVFSFLSSIDVNVVGNDARAFTRPLYHVRGYTQMPAVNPSMVTVEQIAQQIDVALLGSRANLPVPNISVLGTFREQPVRMVEILQGVRWVSAGGRYRMFVSALS